MVEILQAFARIVIAIISGAMLLFGTVYLADVIMNRTENPGPCSANYQVNSNTPNSALEVVGKVLKDGETRLLWLSVLGVIAYAIGTVNVALSNLLFTWPFRIRGDDLLVVSEIESLKKPQLLKESLDLLNVRRTLVAYAFPLVWLGVWLTLDCRPWANSALWFHRGAGVMLMLMGVAAPFIGWRISHRIDATLKTLSANGPEKSDTIPSETVK